MKSNLGTRLRTDINNGMLDSFTGHLEAICSDKKLAKAIFSETAGKARNNMLEDAWEKAIDKAATPDNKKIYHMLLEKYEELMSPDLRKDINNGMLDSFTRHLESICSDKKSAQATFSETAGKARNNMLEDAWEKAIDKAATLDNKKIFLILLERYKEFMPQALKKMCKKFKIKDLEQERMEIEQQYLAQEDEKKEIDSLSDADEHSSSEISEEASPYAAGDFPEGEIFSPSSAGDSIWLQRIGTKPSTVTTWVDRTSMEPTPSKEAAKER